MWLKNVILLSFLAAYVSSEWVPMEDYHYYFSSTTSNQPSAVQSCKGFGAQLTSIVDEAEQTFLRHQIARIEQTGYWIGLHTDDPCGSCADRQESSNCITCRNKWKWLDNQPYGYQNWETKEPNSNGNKCGRWFGQNSQWRDEGCSAGYRYICKSKDLCKTIPNICINGNCSMEYTPERYICTCEKGYEGRNCSQEINECQSSPCKNEGNCTDKFADYECKCPVFWTGKNCERDVDECDGNTVCKNGGTCYNFLGGFNCTCRSGFTDLTCGSDIDECLSNNPCPNGTTCRNLPGSFKCDSNDDSNAERSNNVLHVVFYVSLAWCSLTGLVCLIMLLNDIRETRFAKPIGDRSKPSTSVVEFASILGDDAVASSTSKVSGATYVNE